jgi:hypothetical protein
MTAMATERRYQAVLYHDEPEEAATDSRVIGPRYGNTYETRDAAVAAIREELDAYWQTGSVHAGEYDPGVPGRYPPRFDDDMDELALRVGPDWIEE